MKSVFPDKDIFANYDLDVEKHLLEFVLDKYPEYIFGVDVGLVNKLETSEYKYLVKNNLVKEFFTRIYYEIKEDRFDSEKLLQDYPELVKTITMLKDLKKELIKEYKHKHYEDISEEMAISLLIIAFTGEVDSSVFSKIEE